jgi:fucose 4-O-acetylase-like acetyltransferase
MQPVTRPVDEPRTGSRIDWIDAAKGLGIVLIVLGHIYSVAEPSPLYVFIYAFHVPLFFFIAGLTYRFDPPALPAFFRKKLRALLVPYLCYAALGYLFYLAGYWAAARSGLKLEQFNHGLLTPFLGIFYGSLGDGHLVNTPVWFVIALFCTLMVGHLLRNLTASFTLRMFIALLLAAGAQAVAPHMKLPFSLGPALVGLVFFEAGVAFQGLARSGGPSAGWRWGGLVICLLISLFSQVNGFVTMAETRLGHPALFLLFAFSGLFMVLAFVQLLGSKGRFLAWIGRYSLSIMLIHMLIIKSVKVVLAGVLSMPIREIEASVGLGLVVLAVTAVVLIPVVAVMENALAFSLGKTGSVRLTAGGRA